MKLRRTFRYHSLSRVRIRQTWNKYNLFNLAVRSPTPKIINKTFFQQKWIAKSLLRGYHGEHIKENQWERMFSRRLQSVVGMNPKYMARSDGSEQATGRGRGREEDPMTLRDEQNRPKSAMQLQGTSRFKREQTPHMQMTFAPMERRLDIAIYRSLFASSARQARQFVVHGAVTVNGKKMIYPGYQLNPGDLFQVDIDRVLYATGEPKPPVGPNYSEYRVPSNEKTKKSKYSHKERREYRALKAAETPKTETSEEADPKPVLKHRPSSQPLIYQIADKVKKLLGATKQDADAEKTDLPKKVLRKRVRDFLIGKIKEDRVLRRTLEPENADLPTMSERQLTVPNSILVARLGDQLLNLPAQPESGSSEPALDRATKNRLKEVIETDETLCQDVSKPYVTPWRPRKFMPAFAYIPRYLEVNQKICAAVYLRHPVSRSGSSEIPSPYPPELSQLAFNWYLRRR